MYKHIHFHTDKRIHRVYKSLWQSPNEFSHIIIALRSKDAATYILFYANF